MQNQLQFEYDVFISYSSHDKDWVRNDLLKRIEQAGQRVFIDFRDFKRGALGLKEMARGVIECRKTFIVLTPAYIGSEWCELERAMAMQILGPANRNLRLIPLLKTPCEKPDDLKPLTHIDFTDGADIELAWQQLLNVLEVPQDMTGETIPCHPHRITIHDSSEFDFEDLKQLIELDDDGFDDPENRVPDSTIKQWLNQNNRIYIIAQDFVTKRLVGYIGAFPLTEDAFKRTLTDKSYLDSKLSAADIQPYVYDIPDFYNLYLESCVVHKNYVNKPEFSVYSKLYYGLINFLIKLANQEIFFKEVSSRAVSYFGNRICKSLSMKPVGTGDHCATIWYSRLFPPDVTLPKLEGRELSKIYNDFFINNTPKSLSYFNFINKEIQLLNYCELSSRSFEFKAAYRLISENIPPEYVETEDFVRNRLRVKEQGAQTPEEHLLIPDGFGLHMIAAIEIDKVVGDIFGCHIPKADLDDRGVGFVSYIVVKDEYQQKGIGKKLVEALLKAVNEDAIALTGKPAIGMLFEIEESEHEAVKNLVMSFGGYPLDFRYYQPSVRKGCDAQIMDLWFVPFEPPILSAKDAPTSRFSSEFIHKMVKAVFVNVYPGHELRGFDMHSLPYKSLLESLEGRTEIGFKMFTKSA